MITITMGKKYWTAEGHAPKYICFCVSRMMDIVAILSGWGIQGGYIGFSKVKAPRGTLKRGATHMFDALSFNYPKHVRLGKPDPKVHG